MEDDIKEKCEAAIVRAAAAYGLKPEGPGDRERLLGILAQQRFPPLKILERPMNGDQIDFSPRGEVVRRIERIKYDATRGTKAFDTALKEFDLARYTELCITPDREHRSQVNSTDRLQDVSDYFDYLDRYFIARHAADNAELADDGYYCVDSLIFSAWAAGCCLNDIMAKKVKARLDGQAGGKKAGAKAQAAAKKWTDEALLVAKEYAALNPDYSQDAVASHIEYMLDPLVTHGQIKNVISEWQNSGDLSKKIKKKQVKLPSLNR